MFIDYLPLLLLNMAAGLTVLAGYLNGFLNSQEDKGWAAAFLGVGTVAFIFGAHMTLIWPLPGSYNVAFGELSVLFGALYLAAGLAIIGGFSLAPLGLYAVFAGTAAVVIGTRIINLGMTQSPLVSGVGFIITGLGGIGILPVLAFPRNKGLRILVTILLVLALLLWAYLGYFAYWGHLKNFAQWKPLLLR